MFLNAFFLLIWLSCIHSMKIGWKRTPNTPHKLPVHEMSIGWTKRMISVSHHSNQFVMLAQCTGVRRVTPHSPQVNGWFGNRRLKVVRKLSQTVSLSLLKLMLFGFVSECLIVVTIFQEVWVKAHKISNKQQGVLFINTTVVKQHTAERNLVVPGFRCSIDERCPEGLLELFAIHQR